MSSFTLCSNSYTLSPGLFLGAIAKSKFGCQICLENKNTVLLFDKSDNRSLVSQTLLNLLSMREKQWCYPVNWNSSSTNSSSCF